MGQLEEEEQKEQPEAWVPRKIIKVKRRAEPADPGMTE
jgi:hypothetical protein